MQKLLTIFHQKNYQNRFFENFKLNEFSTNNFESFEQLGTDIILL